MEFSNSSILNTVNGDEPFSNLISDEARKAFVDVEEDPEGTLVGTFNGEEVRTPFGAPVVLGSTEEGGFASTDKQTDARTQFDTFDNQMPAAKAPAKAPGTITQEKIAEDEYQETQKAKVQQAQEVIQNTPASIAKANMAEKLPGVQMYADPKAYTRSASQFTSFQNSRETNDAVRWFHSMNSGSIKSNPQDYLRFRKELETKGLNSKDKKTREGARMLLDTYDTYMNNENTHLIANIRPAVANAEGAREAMVIVQEKMGEMFEGDPAMQEQWLQSPQGMQVYDMAMKIGQSYGKAYSEAELTRLSEEQLKADIAYKERGRTTGATTSVTTEGGYEVDVMPSGEQGLAVAEAINVTTGGTGGTTLKAYSDFDESVATMADPKTAGAIVNRQVDSVVSGLNKSYASGEELRAHVLSVAKAQGITVGNEKLFLTAVSNSDKFKANQKGIKDAHNNKIRAQRAAVVRPFFDIKNSQHVLSSAVLNDIDAGTYQAALNKHLPFVRKELEKRGMEIDETEVMETAKIRAYQELLEGIDPVAAGFPQTQADLDAMNDPLINQLYSHGDKLHAEALKGTQDNLDARKIVGNTKFRNVYGVNPRVDFVSTTLDEQEIAIPYIYEDQFKSWERDPVTKAHLATASANGVFDIVGFNNLMGEIKRPKTFDIDGGNEQANVDDLIRTGYPSQAAALEFPEQSLAGRSGTTVDSNQYAKINDVVTDLDKLVDRRDRTKDTNWWEQHRMREVIGDFNKDLLDVYDEGGVVGSGMRALILSGDSKSIRSGIALGMTELRRKVEDDVSNEVNGMVGLASSSMKQSFGFTPSAPPPSELAMARLPESERIRLRYEYSRTTGQEIFDAYGSELKSISDGYDQLSSKEDRELFFSNPSAYNIKVRDLDARLNNLNTTAFSNQFDQMRGKQYTGRANSVEIGKTAKDSFMSDYLSIGRIMRLADTAKARQEAHGKIITTRMGGFGGLVETLAHGE